MRRELGGPMNEAESLLDATKTTHSKVAERLAFLEKHEVEVRVVYPEVGAMGEQVFTAVYLDCVPLGRGYFFVFGVSGKRRLVQTTSVIEMREL